MRYIIFDASTLISLIMNGLFEEIRELRKIFNGKFIITKQVYWEIVDRPIQIKRFEFEALRIKELYDSGVFESPSVVGVNEREINKKTNEILKIANSSFIGQGEEIHLLDFGEASAIALSKILLEKGIENILAIDERTARMICEKPGNMIELLERKLHTKISAKKENFSKFGRCKIIRSSELVYIMWKKGIIKIKDPRTLDALLYAVKFKGCSISDEEIKEIKRIR